MSNSEELRKNRTVAKLPILAAVVALIGLGDAIYLTVHHLNGEQVPCSVTGGCEVVLNSQWAEYGGIPLAAFGAIAYFIAFSLAILTAFGNLKMWSLFSIQVSLMAAASLYFVYLQVFVIKAICQYCMLSAGVCLTLFAIAMISKLIGRKP